MTLTGAKSYSGDRELQLACVRAYNDWMAEFCMDTGGRLVAQAVMPTTNAADAAAELRHAIDTGHRGAIISAFPNGGFALDPTDDEFFGLAQEAAIPLAVHTGSFLPNNPEGMWADLDGMGVLAMGSTAKAGVQSMPVAALLVFSGVLERFPGLRFVLVESNIGWIPTLLEQMDDSFLRFRFYTGAVDKMRRMPSEVFRTSIWATFVNDRSRIEQRERLNIDHVCWSTDYPHSHLRMAESAPRLRVGVPGCGARRRREDGLVECPRPVLDRNSGALRLTMTLPRDTDLLEKAAIRDTLLRYAAGIDRRDWDLMLSCFTENAWTSMQGNDLGHGRDKILAYITSAASEFRIVSSVHFLANMYIELAGDRATADTYGIGYLVFAADADHTLRMRHLRYIDELVRSDDGSWLIAKRILTNDWERLTPVDAL